MFGPGGWEGGDPPGGAGTGRPRGEWTGRRGPGWRRPGRKLDGCFFRASPGRDSEGTNLVAIVSEVCPAACGQHSGALYTECRARFVDRLSETNRADLSCVSNFTRCSHS